MFRSLRLTGALSLICLSGPAFAQTRHPAAARATADLSEIARRPKPQTRAAGVPPREVYEPERAVRRQNFGRTGAAPRQIELTRAIAPATVVPTFSGFLGLADNFTSIPPDTQGAVGPNHIVTMLNTQVTIQSRAGVTEKNFPVSLDEFWSPLGNFNDTFDPRVLYDSVANRWIASVAVNGESPASALLVATSQTSDPTGKWNYYKVNVGNTDLWGDFPALGFNGSWVVVSLNIFTIRSGAYRTTNLYVFSKADLYDLKGTGAHATFSDARGEFAPVRDYDNSQPNTLYLVQQFATDFGPLGSASVRLSKLTGTVGSEVFQGGNAGQISISSPWSDTGGNSDFAPQLGTSVRIDAGDSRLGNCVLRASRIWCAHTVFVPYPQPTRAAAQWFEIDPAPNPPLLVQRGRVEDPTDTYSYAYPSIAVNKNNDALISYTRFSSKDYPTAAFAFRTAADPLNAMQPEVIVKPGESAYVSLGARSGANRWGDYSATIVDPVNDLTFWTLQEYAATPPGTRTGAFGTWWAQISPPSVVSTCTYKVTPATASFDWTGGTGALTVNTQTGCPWQATSNNPWLTITSGSPGNGAGTVQYTAAKATTVDSRTGTLTVAGQTITITQGPAPANPQFTAVVNGASLTFGAVSPGEVITIFGSNLGPETLQKPPVTAAGEVATIAGGARLLFDGVAAPLIYAVSGQIAAVTPFGLAGRSTTQVQVEYLGVRSAAVTVAVVPASPAIFTVNQSGRGQGAVLNQNGSVNSALNAAAVGDVVVIYATGGGVLANQLADGMIAPRQLWPLANAATVRIGGQAATVTYAGAAPGIIAGVVQINAIVPQGIAKGDAVPIDVAIAGFTSPGAVTIAVR